MRQLNTHGSLPAASCEIQEKTFVCTVFLYVVERFYILSKFSSKTCFTASLTDVKYTKYSCRKDSKSR